jgi:hypothetical protein
MLVFVKIRGFWRFPTMYGDKKKQFCRFSPSKLTPKFIRHHDLTFQVRLALDFESYTAQINKEGGVISKLTR